MPQFMSCPLEDARWTLRVNLDETSFRFESAVD